MQWHHDGHNRSKAEAAKLKAVSRSRTKSGRRQLIVLRNKFRAKSGRCGSRFASCAGRNETKKRVTQAFEISRIAQREPDEKIEMAVSEIRSRAVNCDGKRGRSQNQVWSRWFFVGSGRRGMVVQRTNDRARRKRGRRHYPAWTEAC
jgi:hypothetical protein